MTEIEKKALALVSEVMGVRLSLFERSDSPIHEALCRAIDQHEAFKQEVSDAVEKYFSMDWNTHKMAGDLRRFIIPKPVDPLVEAVGDALEAQGMGRPKHTTPELTDQLRAALAKRGFKIVEDGYDRDHTG